jgi:3-oxoacyl-[acyl-carrier-protein] synthase II
VDAPEEVLGAKLARQLDRAAGLGIMAARAVAAEAELAEGGEPDPRLGIYYGTAFGGVPAALDNCTRWCKDEQFRLPPSAVLQSLAGIAAFQVAELLGARGPSRTVSTACSSGLAALVDAADAVRRGRADRVLVFSGDSPFHPANMEAWDRLGVMSRSHDDPARAARPFNADRAGFVMGEGAAAVLVETAASARAAGRTPRARLLGVAGTTSGGGVTTPDAEAQARLVELVLEDAGLEPDAVGLVMAHASGTKRNDRVEAEVLRGLFGEGEGAPWVFSSKPCVGHTMGVAGLLEVVIACQILEDGRVPRLANYSDPDPACPVKIAPEGGAALARPVALVEAFAFGGNNAGVVLDRGQGGAS